MFFEQYRVPTFSHGFRSMSLAAHLLGPALTATICTPDLDRSIEAWRGSLHHAVAGSGTLSAERAEQLGASRMAGARYARLANEPGEDWLELIEHCGAAELDPFAHSGWFSLEISVADVDHLRTTLDENMFRVIGEPANLEMSDNIRAMQVIGPAGEVLYLTEIKAEVPPFDLPFARCAVDRLFIPVILAGNRDTAAAVYEQLNGHAGMRFDTKITVINRARGLDISTQHPVCAQQLAGANLIEIDQLQGLRTRIRDDQTLPTGIVAITFSVNEIPTNLPHRVATQGPHEGCRTASLRGDAGELIQLVE